MDENLLTQLLNSKQFDDPLQQRYWDKHIPQLPVKTIVKKVIHGDIFPEHLSADQMKKKMEDNQSQGNNNPNNVQSVQAEIKQLKEGDEGYFDIEGNAANIHKATNVFIYGTEIAECEDHIKRPYIYPTRIEEKKSRAQKLKEAKELLVKEFNEMEWKYNIKYGPRQDFLKRNYDSYLEAKPKKEKYKQKENFWNSSANIQKSFQDTSKKQKPRDPQEYTVQLINTLKQMPFKERENFFQKGLYNLHDKEIYKGYEELRDEPVTMRKLIQNFCTSKDEDYTKFGDKIYQFKEINEFKEFMAAEGFDPKRKDIHKILENNLYDKEISKGKDNKLDNLANIRQLFKFYSLKKKIDPSVLTKHLLVDLEQFEDFIKTLGYEQSRTDEIEEFFYQVYDERAFEDIQVSVQTAAQMFATGGGRSLKRKKQMISLKSFFWNYERFLRLRTNLLDQKFSHLKCKQISINIRDHLCPWKKNYSLLKSNLSKLKESEQLMLDVINKYEPYVSDQINQMIEERNQNIKFKRAIANNLYRPLKDHLISFEEIKNIFIQKILKISSEITLFEEFTEGFRLHKEELHEQNNDNERLTSFNLCDIAEYVRTQDYDQNDVSTIITYVKKVYNFQSRDLNQRIQISDIRSFISSFTDRKQKSYQLYKSFLEDLHHKIEKHKLQYEKEKRIKILDNEVRLYEANRKPIKQKVREFSNLKHEQNMIAQSLLKYTLKINKKILKQFFIISSLIKLVQDHEFIQNLSETELIKKVNAILNTRQIPLEFTNKFIFSETLLVIAKKYCADIKDKAKDEHWDEELEKAMQIFHCQAENLNQILYEWKYQDEEGNDYEDPELIVPEEDEGKVINVLDQIDSADINKIKKKSNLDQFRDKYSKYVSPEKRKQKKEQQQKQNLQQSMQTAEDQMQILQEDTNFVIQLKIPEKESVKDQQTPLNLNQIQKLKTSVNLLEQKEEIQNQIMQSQSQLKQDDSKTPNKTPMSKISKTSNTFNVFSDKIQSLKKQKNELIPEDSKQDPPKSFLQIPVQQEQPQPYKKKSSISFIKQQQSSQKQNENNQSNDRTPKIKDEKDEGGDIQSKKPVKQKIKNIESTNQNKNAIKKEHQKNKIQYEKQNQQKSEQENEKSNQFELFVSQDLDKENSISEQESFISRQSYNKSNNSYVSISQIQQEYQQKQQQQEQDNKQKQEKNIQNHQILMQDIEKELMTKSYGGCYYKNLSGVPFSVKSNTYFQNNRIQNEQI